MSLLTKIAVLVLVGKVGNVFARVCDNFVLSNSSLTSEGLSEILGGNTAPTFLGHRFRADLVLNSFCVNIYSCVSPNSPSHRELMMAMNRQRSLSWKVLPCHRQLSEANKITEKEQGLL